MEACRGHDPGRKTVCRVHCATVPTRQTVKMKAWARLAIEGFDYTDYPGAAAIRTAGRTFVCRYIPYNNVSKGLTKTELADLLAHKIAVVFVFEMFAGDAVGEGGRTGTADAQLALAGMRSLGVPDTVPIYFAVDIDARPEQQVQIDSYLRAAGSILGPQRIGVYGGYWVIQRCATNRSAIWYWQTYAWSGGNVSSAAHIYQYWNGQTLNGKSVDYNRALKPDFGQYPRPAAQMYGLPGWPAYAKSTLAGAQGYAYRIFVNAGKAPASATAGNWGANGWPAYARQTFASASAYALRVFVNNPSYKP